MQSLLHCNTDNAGGAGKCGKRVCKGFVIYRAWLPWIFMDIMDIYAHHAHGKRTDTTSPPPAAFSASMRP